MKKTGTIVTCLTCSKKVYMPAWRIIQGFKFCSRKCFRHTENTKKIIGEIGLGRRPWNKGFETGLIPKSAFKKGLIPWNKGKEFIQVKGDKNTNWKGGITPISHQIRASIQYKKWRSDVFNRDNFTCQICGEKEKVSGKLEADHIKPFSLYPKLRFNTKNGRTLCKECHKNTDTYLWKIRKNSTGVNYGRT